MRRLLLLRHAKSAYPVGVADHERPLNARGRAAAPRMGAYLAAEGLRPDHVMVSSARRTQETWEGVLDALPGLEAERAPSLYDAGAARILDAIGSAPGKASVLLVIGHNPGLQDLAVRLAGAGSPALRQAMREKFPTAALAVLDFDGADWGGIGRAEGRLERFVSPKTLADQAARR